MSSMPNRPLLLRSSPVSAPELTRSERVARNIRFQLGAERLGTSFFAHVASVSKGRARNVYYGRQPATVAELADLSNALGVPIASFFEGL